MSSGSIVPADLSQDQRTRFAIVGGGPAGNTASMVAASLGAEVTLIEDSVVGGAAHLWDCIPSKTMVATSRRMDAIRNAADLGLVADPASIDLRQLEARIESIAGQLGQDVKAILDSQGVRIIRGRGHFAGPNELVAVTGSGEVRVNFDAALISTGSAPRIPEWADVDGERVLTTRGAYDLDRLPEHLVIVGSGVTGVEFVHIFSSLGSQVTLVVSRQQVLPHYDTEVAAVLEADFLSRGVELVKGARASAVTREGDVVIVDIEDGRKISGSHVLLTVGSEPLTENLGLEIAGVKTEQGYVAVDEWQRTSVQHIYAAGDVTGQMPLSSVAAMQGRKIARHIMGIKVKPLDYRKVSQAIFTRPEIASVGLEEAVATSQGRKVRITKVPFAANSRSVIEGRTEGFVKVISDPATQVVLGGTIVGYRASELIGILALAVQGGLPVDVLVETLMVHPSLSESLTDAAD